MDEQTTPTDEPAPRLVARFYAPLRVEGLGDLARALEVCMGATCYVSGSNDPDVLFQITTRDEPAPRDPTQVQATFG